MVKYTAPDSAVTQSRFSKGALKWARVAFWIGLALLIADFVFIVVAVFMGGGVENFYDKYGLYFVIVAAVPFAFGLVLSIMLKKNIKNAAISPTVSEYTFEEEFMLITTYRRGEVIAESKVYYKDMVKIKNKKDFIALYPNSVTAYVIFKDGLTKEELDEVCGYLKI